MSRQVFELETLLAQLIDEHKKLVGHLDRQQAAMRAFDLKTMDEVVRLAEATRLRIAGMESKRRALITAIARAHRMSQMPTLPDIATMYPPSAPKLLKLRDELKSAIQSVQKRSNIAGKVASAVLGHLNTAVRLLSSTVKHAGTYTKQGTPRVSNRIGVMEAVA